jgi:ABC-type spermidine/putrescine transport system permease subunit I
LIRFSNLTNDGLREAKIIRRLKEEGVEGMRRMPSFLPPLFLLFPAVAMMVALYGYPFVSSIYRSFFTKEGTLTLANYNKTVDFYLPDILFTLEVSVLSTAISAILSILLAVYLRFGTGRVVKFIGALYRLPIFIPFVVVAQMMRTFLAPHGFLNLGLAKSGLINIDYPFQLFNLTGLTFGFVWKQMPFMVLLIFGGFQMIDDTYIEAARSVGAKLPQIISKILIPMGRGTISVAIILVFSSIVGTFTLPYMLIGGKMPTTITVDIAHRVNYFGDWGVANALGVFSYLLVIFMAIYYLRHMVRKGIYE